MTLTANIQHAEALSSFTSLTTVGALNLILSRDQSAYEGLIVDIARRGALQVDNYLADPLRGELRYGGNDEHEPA